MSLGLLVAITYFVSTSLIFFWVTNDAQKEPYMDEVFHVPQAQHYCAGNFTSWDPMITTLPGLYLLSLPLLFPLTLQTGTLDLTSICTTPALRGINILFSLGNLYLVYLIAHKLHFNGKNIGQVALTAVALATFPVLYFCTFLYYTDPAAVFFALLSYFLVLSDRHTAAAATGVVGIVCRQTNIIWIAFTTGLTIGKILIQWIQLDKKRDPEQPRLSDWSVLSKTLSLLGRSVQHNPQELINLAVKVVKAVWCYSLVAVGFVAFIVVNGGIVVGDRTSHESCLHFPQLFYFLFITTFFSFMHMISVKKVEDFCKYVLKNPLKTVLFLLVAVFLVAKFTVVHSYNLSDNRHYNFYFLSKIIRRSHYSKFILVPVYYYAFVTFWTLLQGKDIFWKISYLICTTASMVPHSLVEFRYFIIPYLIFRLNMKMPSKLLLVVEIMFYLAINAWTVYMYVFKTFQWPNSESPQRFIW